MLIIHVYAKVSWCLTATVNPMVLFFLCAFRKQTYWLICG
ncbi:hypothetical protein THERMOT_1060 [Bathymodiolus thermophilus thioautotrophic gill symbiont]|uniref:Uncharacterized protein n=1 Tax=Bathymodiolus thermophilus thioautotrophic gill symbiont TaxID=2360 RepID=A0A8H9CGQ2_9GAMM|nr:hypothetical protein THERMOS_374 [Bathymodiolus thermophilus thioautotrophic gill symbiont]CAB5499514.1 hypothetical protein THERMOT_1060 [Bathymodiolus thermophilus thioautotrophic gill symbiont]